MSDKRKRPGANVGENGREEIEDEDEDEQRLSRRFPSDNVGYDEWDKCIPSIRETRG